MSEYFGLSCLDCKRRTENNMGGKNGKEQLQKIIENQELVVSAFDLGIFMLDVGYAWSVVSPIEFVRRHKGHKIEVRSEYDKTVWEFELEEE